MDISQIMDIGLTFQEKQVKIQSQLDLLLIKYFQV
ncbi:unnamed protein product [Paramecium pentaurelia]|uniref:Uncharacterized protein n=1 Tax=Paramecium pentaurelia TaxID=43138 RepID=A0A8S1XMY0_9CILI|nr:unnamed protein product [Paramecium pentaurelia]